MRESVYDILGPEGYMMLYRKHLESAMDEVTEWHQHITRLGLPSTGRLLDIGCGLGERTAAWSARGYSVTGIDRSRLMLVTARSRFPGLEILERDALECSQLGSFDLAVAHFNFLLLLPTPDLLTLLRELRICVAPGGAFVTDLCEPQEQPLPFRESWSIAGKILTEVGEALDDSYRHRWFEDSKELCEEQFWFRPLETYKELAAACGWSVRFLQQKTDLKCKNFLAVFTQTERR